MKRAPYGYINGVEIIGPLNERKFRWPDATSYEDIVVSGRSALLAERRRSTRTRWTADRYPAVRWNLSALLLCMGRQWFEGVAYPERGAATGHAVMA